MQEIENGLPSVNYIRTLNIDEPLARVELAAGKVQYYHTDALGSVIALTDENGAVRTTYSYDPFGNTTIAGEASDNPFQYTGRENDGTGLYYYRARYYSPELQRFISEDPIGLNGGDINFFVYTRNNPLNYKDPEGQTPAMGIGAAFGGLVGYCGINCTIKCTKRCGTLYPAYQDPTSPDRQKFFNCMFGKGKCMVWCASFGLFGSDPLTGAVTAPFHGHAE